MALVRKGTVAKVLSIGFVVRRARRSAGYRTYSSSTSASSTISFIAANAPGCAGFGRSVQQVRDVARLTDRALARGGLNWYRAIPLSDPRSRPGAVSAPTLMVWSDGDGAIDRAGPEASGRYVTGPFRFVELPGVSHWIPDEAPEALAELVVEHIGGRD